MNGNNFFANACLTFFKAVLFILFCCVLGVLIVLPLWKFSTSFPKVYTVCAIVLILSFTVFKIVTLAKKSSKRKIAKTVLQLFVIVGGFCAIVALVLNGYRFFALPIFVLIPVLHLALASFFRESK